jgi:hypothetical protein
MSLASGTRLGPYEILSPLGAGGMGEVYRARDTRLDRDVAIKVLPAALAQDADRLTRFEREARAIAALSHPNILAIHDIGAHDGQTYVVIELLDGETLRDRLTTGALPLRKAIDTAVQIARGLAAAHDKGLVHRDLKPENLFLLKDGQVKILDFGLAKTMPTGSGATATIAAVTDPGSVMGTVGYMAPEQVRGQAIDARADLFAFGAVLYEMLSGQRAFQRDTAADTMTAILREDPPELSSTRTNLSPVLDRIVRHSVEKNPNERFQTARDVAFALEALSGTGVASSGFAAVVPSGPKRRGRAVAIGALLILTALTAGILIGRRLTGTTPTIAFEAKTWDAQWITNARFGSDGRTIVFSAALSGNIPDLFVLRPGAVGAQPIGPPHTHLLSVSSKDELAVLIDLKLCATEVGLTGTLARMPLDGAPRPVLERVRAADWAPDGVNLAVIRDDGSRDHLEYPIGHVLYQPSAGYLSDVRVSRDGAHVAFLEHHIRFDDRGSVKVVDTSGHMATLAGEFRAGWGLSWSADDQFVWFSASDQGDTALQAHLVNIAGTPTVSIALPSAGALVMSDVAADGHLLVTQQHVLGGLRALLPGAVGERDVAGNTAYGGILSRDGRLFLYGDRSPSAGANYAVALRKTDGSPPVTLGEGDPFDLSPDLKWALAMIDSTDQFVRYPTGSASASTSIADRSSTTSQASGFRMGRGCSFAVTSRHAHRVVTNRRWLAAGPHRSRPTVWKTG